MTGTLVLTRSQVARLLTLDACIDAVERALVEHASGRSLAPQILGVHGPGGAFHIKAAGLLGRKAYFVTKINANFAGNPARGLPRIQGVVALFDARDGRPLALLDSMELTALRTAAMTAVAARRLARTDARTATICGCGLQGRVQLRALLRVRRIQHAWCWDVAPAATARFAREMSRELRIAVEPARRLPDALRRSDVIVTCTPARRFFVRARDVGAGAFVAGVGADSPEKQELDPELLAKGRVVVDSLEQAATIGDLQHALRAGAMTRRQVHGELADVVAGRTPGRRSPRELFVFDSTGIALQDVAAAARIYERALAQRVGRRVAIAR